VEAIDSGSAHTANPAALFAPLIAPSGNWPKRASYGYGTVFSLNPGTDAENVLHSFGSGTDGRNPYAGLINAKGTLYGTTYAGGAYGDGTVFSIVP
jgi:uncharacterized repeat protein (TIGR03803 family)